MLVASFPKSATRPDLWQNFLWLIDQMRKLGLRCKLWIDGSFVTEKIDPDDIDFIADFDFDFLNSLNVSQGEFVERLHKQEFRPAPRKLHSFIKFSAPVMHKRWPESEQQRLQWEKDWGRSLRKKTPKGIIIFEVVP